jgi:tetratricopeptide (TPR) repeat protein
MKRALLCLAIAGMFTGIATDARAESLDAIFRSGNEAFFHGDFPTALQRYRRLTDAGIHDPDVFMNIGLAHAHAGELGRAILAFEQTLALRPGDPEAANALATARAAVGKHRAERQGEALVETRPPLAEALVRPYGENTLAVLSLLFDAVFFGCLWARRRSRSDQVRTGLAVTASLTGLCAVVALTALFIKRGGLSEGEPAIVLREGAEVREAPDPRAIARAYAHEGGSAKVVARDGGFVRVRTAAGAVGWMTQDDVGVVAQ